MSLHLRFQRIRLHGFILLIIITAVCYTLGSSVMVSAASIELVGSSIARNSSVSGSSISAQAGDQFVILCSANSASSIAIQPFLLNAPSTTVISSTGTPAMTIARAEAASNSSGSFQCTGSGAASAAIHIYKVTGLTTTDFSSATAAGEATTFTLIGTGTTSAPYGNSYIFGHLAVTGGQTISGSWSMSSVSPVTQLFNGGTASGSNSTKLQTSGAAGPTTSSTASGSNTTQIGALWRGQIAAFRITPTASLSVGLVNSSDTPLNTPSFPMTSTAASFSCQTTTGTFGTSNAKIRASTDSTPSWNLSLAATNGPSALWSGGSGTNYSFNNAAGSGCTGGQLSIDGSTATYQSACTNPWQSVNRLTTSASFASGSSDAITLMSGSSGATVNCIRDIYGYTLSQTIPPERRSGTYSLGLTLTMTAS